MVVRKKTLDKKKEITPELESFVEASPDEKKKDKDNEMLNRKSFTFRINPDLWIDFEYHCKKNGISRSDIIEDMILKVLKKKKDEYR